MLFERMYLLWFMLGEEVRIAPIIEINFIASEVLFERTKHFSKNQSLSPCDFDLIPKMKEPLRGIDLIPRMKEPLCGIRFRSHKGFKPL